MVYRMYTVPLSEEHFEKQKEYILSTARMNSYKENTVKHIMRRKERQLKRREVTHLFSNPLACTYCGRHSTNLRDNKGWNDVVSVTAIKK